MDNISIYDGTHETVIRLLKCELKKNEKNKNCNMVINN